MEDARIAYIAGIIDGEGSIMIQKADHPSYMKQRGKGKAAFFAGIRVGMIDKRALDFIVDTLKVGKVTQEKAYQRKRPMFRWQTHKKEEVKDILKKLIPYLLVKSEQAFLAIDFIEKSKRFHRYNPIPDEEQKRRISYWIKMKELNGIASPATTERKGKSGRWPSIRIEATV